VKRPAEALPYLDRLVTEFEQSEYLVRHRKTSPTQGANSKENRE